jgi:ABC-type antimicrobial peptide transport system permease subunit
MKLRTLIKRSLCFHWRSHLGVVIGAAIGSAALIGALIVGDSVKGSLKREAMLRLGIVQFALDGKDRTFTDKLASRPMLDAEADSAAQAGFDSTETWPPLTKMVLRLSGTASAADGSQRANAISIYGIPKSLPDDELQFATPDDIWKWPVLPSLLVEVPPLPDSGEVWLNQNLAQHLRLQVGDPLLLRLPKRQALSSDAPISTRTDAIGLRLKITRVFGADEFADFDLRSSGVPPFNAFVNLSQLQQSLQLEGRANLLLSVGMVDVSAHTQRKDISDSLEKVSGGMARLFDGLFGTYELQLYESAQIEKLLEDGLKKKARLADFEASLRATSSSRELELLSERVFLDAPLIRSALAADTNAHPLLTYLANLISVGSNATPYSMVTAAGAPWTPADLRDDEIVLNQWLAKDLHAKPGDAVTLVYYDPESGARLTERTNTFRVHSIVPMEMPWADRTLMPQFPGIEKAETTAEWDTAFPLVHTIRPQDDDYWTEYRGTPKAFVTLAAGQKMWANRFGNLTAIRFPIPTNLVSSTSALTPALSPRERENSSPSLATTNNGDSSTASQQPESAQSLSPLPGGEGQGEGERFPNSIETIRAALEKKILATLKPEELGLRFEPVREQALKAAEQSQDFGGLFIGFSLFVIVAALLLMALLFQFSLEQRTAEIGTLLALGFTPKQVRRLFLREGAALALLGGVLGTLGGIGYARAMLHGLTTLWSDAVGGSALKFFVTPQTLVIGLLASTVVAVFTLWLALRKQARQPARVLLTGALECGDSSPLFKNTTKVKDSAATPKPTLLKRRGRVRALQGWLPLVAALSLIGWTLVNGDTANAGAFFGAGALVLIAGLSFLNTRLVPRQQSSAILNPPSAQTLALRGLTRRRSRSVATAAMLASGTFLIVSIGVFRLDANRDATKRTSGTGGFALIGESTMPVVADLNTKAGRETFALNEADFADVNFVQFRVRAGDEASCLNLNRAQKPRLLGVNPEALEGRFTFVKGGGWPSLRSSGRESAPSESEIRNPQSAINQSLLTSAATNEVAAIGDAASIQWAMGKKVGDTVDYVDERGQPFKVRIVGAVANSILQGQLIIDEAEFVKRFPGESGYKYFLIDAPTNRVGDVSAKLSRALQDAGLELTPAPQRLAQFNAVQNTYLGTFQILGGLGLLLGSAGLGIVVLRNVLERRGELAVLLAVGWRRGAVNQLVLREHLALLGLGLAVGLVAALVAVLPSVLTPGAEFPWLTLTLTLAAVLANGILWTWLAARVALRGELLAALRGE